MKKLIMCVMAAGLSIAYLPASAPAEHPAAVIVQTEQRETTEPVASDQVTEDPATPAPQEKQTKDKHGKGWSRAGGVIIISGGALLLLIILLIILL